MHQEAAQIKWKQYYKKEHKIKKQENECRNRINAYLIFIF